MTCKPTKKANRPALVKTGIYQYLSILGNHFLQHSFVIAYWRYSSHSFWLSSSYGLLLRPHKCDPILERMKWYLFIKYFYESKSKRYDLERPNIKYSSPSLLAEFFSYPRHKIMTCCCKTKLISHPLVDGLAKKGLYKAILSPWIYITTHYFKLTFIIKYLT